MKLWKAVVPALLLLALVAAMPAAAAPPSGLPTPPPTLTGEVFRAFQAPSGVSCTGGTGSFTYTVSGTATGPYTGTFTESGTGTVTNSTLTDFSTLTAFSATFTITSPTGSVTGKKTLTSTATAVCYQGTNFLGLFNAAATTYQATIHTGDGDYTDHGASRISQLFVEPTGVDLIETYTSSQTQTTLIVPTSAEQCKDGGWQSFGVFKNQGDCVSFVATGGTNPPAGA